MKTPRAPRPFLITVLNRPTPEEASALVSRVAPLIGALLRDAEQRVAREEQDRNTVADAAADLAVA